MYEQILRPSLALPPSERQHAEEQESESDRDERISLTNRRYHRAPRLAYPGSMKWTVALFLVTACGGSTDDTSSTTSGGGGSGATSSGGSTSGGSGGTTSGGGGGAPSGGGGGTSGASTDAGSFVCEDGGSQVDAGMKETIAASCVVAVVQVTRLDIECSGAGGTHVTLDVVKLGRGSGVTRIRFGDHAYWPPPEGPDQLGEWFVAGIDPYGGLIDQPDNAGWCLVGLPSVDGEARALLEATSETDATQKMNAILAP